MHLYMLCFNMPIILFPIMAHIMLPKTYFVELCASVQGIGCHYDALSVLISY